MTKTYAAKVLLFGEYGIIKGSQGLAIPLSDYYGKLSFKPNKHSVEQKLRLDEFHQYLKGSELLSTSMDLVAFYDDIQAGEYFDSNIPHGYGIGSSGALCAAVYAKYSDFERKEHYSEQELKHLKDIMALMESFYHGSSSGVDCLISLINLPLLIESRSQIKPLENPNLDEVGDFYLYDSGHGRKTAAFVHDFLSRYDQNSSYRQNINQFIELTNQAISHLLKKEANQFDEVMHDLSRLQYLHFSKMIPDSMKNLWLHGLETKQFYLKLCGAGGGGYSILYTRSNEFKNSLVNDNHYKKIS